MNVQKIGENLVLNAIEFAERASKDLKEENYKFCLVNFCAAIEQIIKARLMLEHWSLVIIPNDLDSKKIKDFESGNFKTISITTAIQRSTIL